jgi:hypothetical protein
MKGRSATNVARIFMDNTDHVMTAAYQELKDAMQFKRVNEELLEYLSSSIRWLLHYSKKNNIPLPEKDKIHKIVDRAMAIADKLPRDRNNSL